MSGFNTSTKKEDLSLKLKSQNIRNSKEQTKRLEDESRKMELRLNELKLAMSMEKEEREKQGGGSHWKSGKTDGTLTTHAQDVLKKNLRQIEKSKSRGSKGRKITVLKDTPIVPPAPSDPQPGTMAYLAKSDPHATPKESARLKGPKCGQCERKVAAVVCHECGEDYCPACFASFHLKGALRKHRSMPIQASGPRPSPRVAYEPRPPLQQVQNEMSPQQKAMREFEKRQSTPRVSKPVTQNGVSASTGVPAQFSGPSLLEGEYNEEDNAAAFQAALQEWRGEKTAKSTSSKASTGTRTYSPAKTPTVNIDDSTSTNPIRNTTPEIKFHSSMTYSEKLLLKKHRRTELDAMPTPRLDDHPALSSRENGTYVVEENGVNVLRPSYDEERVDFRALYEAAVSPRSETELRRPASIVEVSEVEANTMKDVEQVSNYQVLENSDPQEDDILRSSKKNQKNSKASSASKSGRRLSAEKSKPPLGNQSNVQRENTGSRSSMKFERENTGSKSSNRLERENTKNKVKNERPSSQAKDRKSDPKISEKRGSVGKLESEKSDVSIKNSVKPPVSLKKAKSAENVKAVSGRPPSRAKSRSGTTQSRAQSRATSRAGSRPGSRARPWSRADIPEGNLTKRPSADLKAIASRSAESVSLAPYMGLQDVLTIGVSQPAPQVDRVKTPSFNRPGIRAQSAKKGPTVSYKFYQMSPRSWKPQVSLGDQVDIQPGDLQDYDRAFAMAESETPSLFEDKELEQEIKALAGITQPSPEVVRERTGLHQREEEDLPPVPASPDIAVPSLAATPIPTNSPTITPRPPQSSNTTRRRSNRSVTPRKQMTPRSPDLPRLTTPEVAAALGYTGTPSSSEESPRFKDVLSAAGRESRMIVVDGDDMSEFDQRENVEEESHNDAEALDQLEWELASETGRLTADGKISRMTLLPSDDESLARSESFGSSDHSGLKTPVTGYEMDPRVSEEELMFDYEDIEQQVADEDEVRALR